MIDHAEFLREIQRQPEAELPRLIYADWLEEQGHPGAELIRLEIARAKLPPWTEEYAALQHRWRLLWEQMDPGFLRPLGYQWLHRPLFTQLPDNREDRWRLVDRFFENWFGGLKAAHHYADADIDEAETRLGFSIPDALREWFTRGGARHWMPNRQDHLRRPSEWGLMRMEVQDELSYGLNFSVENRGGQHWGIALSDLHRDDPPVMAPTYSEQISDSVSRFAVLWILCAAKFTCGDRQAWHNDFNREMLPELGTRFPRADVPERFWAGRVEFYEGPDFILQYDVDLSYLWIAVRTYEAVSQLPQSLVDLLEWTR